MVAYGFAVYYAWVGYGEWMFALALYSGFIGFFLFWLIAAIIHNEYLYKG